MNWDEVHGNWTEVRGKFREQWGKLTDDDLAVIAGRRDQLLGRIQQRYGYTRETVEEEVKQFENRFAHTLRTITDPGSPGPTTTH